MSHFQRLPLLTQPPAQAAQRPRPPSLSQQGCQSILQVNTAINNEVRRPCKEGGRRQAASSPRL